ncbi:uncharacterized protein LOC122317211 isoform X1 [Carya illinoinensis]|uniref:uncharacterized protein LOC122317211 isoform X1 n=1 Tax=Carya illinoinensis TaxID=32201 RepID=UPI001C72726F|nr:uncharacterized protein LOC122317211 isoform X1 [Carya illinoinensis]XP_042990108.1 uncharacterized protein LOC122317211 isoform X1 [Carya illinoinensis]XP_042990109.1 uncharacterized protein LOC122317211 isoform X1 [Carya illinoinensis]
MPRAFLHKFTFHISKRGVGSSSSKLEEMHMEDNDIQSNLQRKLRGHLLFFGITMGLLAEIINSRQNESFLDMKLKLVKCLYIGLDCWATYMRLLFQGRTYHASKILYYHNMKLSTSKTLLMIS